MREDSLELYDLDLESPKFNELIQQVFLFNDGTSKEAKNNILDPYITTVDNTSCASCHRLNDTLFNFHNLSKLETESVNISNRVINDVKYDLNWLNQELK